MDVSKIKGNIDPNAPVHSTRIRVGRNIDGIDLPPNIAYWQLMKIEDMMVDTMEVLGHKHKDLKGKYYALDGMDEEVRQQLVDDHFLFMSGDKVCLHFFNQSEASKFEMEASDWLLDFCLHF